MREFTFTKMTEKCSVHIFLVLFAFEGFENTFTIHIDFEPKTSD